VVRITPYLLESIATTIGLPEFEAEAEAALDTECFELLPQAAATSPMAVTAATENAALFHLERPGERAIISFGNIVSSSIRHLQYAGPVDRDCSNGKEIHAFSGSTASR
jgi:hypothetical protein